MLKPQFTLTHKIPLVVYRREQGRYVDGDWVEGGISEWNITGNIQPARPHELLMFPEAERSKSWWVLYSEFTLRTEREGQDGWDADELDWKDDHFKVMKVNDWTNGMGILEHTESFLVRTERTPN